MVGQNIGNDVLVWWSFPFAEIFSLTVSLLMFSRLYNTIIKDIPEGSNVK